MPVSNTAVNAQLRALVESAIAEWMPAYQSGEEINGADMVDWFGEFLVNAQNILNSPSKIKGGTGAREIAA